MSLIDSVIRGWYGGWAEFPELVAGGAGLLESLIPGEQESLTTAEDYWNKAAENVRSRGGTGQSQGLLEKIAEGVGAVPGTLASMAPFLMATGGAGAIAGPAIGFGIHGLVRTGDEGLPSAVGHGLKGAAEGAIFGGMGRVAGSLTGKKAASLLEKQGLLYKHGTKESQDLAKSMTPEIEAALNLPSAQLKRRAAHAVGAGGIVGGMSLLHGQSLEDAAASAATMGILGGLGGMSPKQIAEAGKYRDPFAAAKRALDELEGEALIAGREMQARKAKEAEKFETPLVKEITLARPEQQPPWTDSVPASDFGARGQKSRPLEKETKSFKDFVEGIEPEGVKPVFEFYKHKGPYEKASDLDTSYRASTEVFRDPQGRIQAPAEHLDAMAWYVKDLQAYHQTKLNDINARIGKASAEGDTVGVQRYQEAKDAHLLQMQADFAQFKGIRSVAGNALRVLRGTTRGTPEWVKQSEVVKKSLGVDADRVIKMLEMSQERPDLLVKIGDAINNPKAWDYFQEYWINGLLSGPPTHAVNILSNALRSSIDVVEKRLALEMEHRRGYLVEDTSTNLGLKKREFLSRDEVRGEFQADVSAGLNVFRTALKAFGEGLRKEDFDPSSIDPAFGMYKRTQKVDYPSKVIGGLPGQIIRFPGRALQAMDVAFKIVAGERAAAAKSYRMASEAIKAGTITEAGRAEYMAKLRGVDGSKPHKDILREMKKQAEMQTFTEDMPEWMAPLGKLRQTEFMGTKPGVAVLPFMSTPFNVIKQSLARSPVGILMHKSIKAKYERGEITPKEYYQEVSATALGSLVTISLVGLAKAGLITGGGPINQQDRQNLIDTGWRPYSLHIPGHGYIQLQRVEPFGTVLGMAGDIAELGDSEDKLGKLMATIKDNATDKSFLYGIESLSKAWSNPEMFFSTYYKQMSGSLVPTALAKAQQAVDPYARQSEALGASMGVPDAMAYRIPGLSQGLSMRTTPFGEPAERWGTLGTEGVGQRVIGAAQSMLSVTPVSAERQGREVEKEFARLSKYPGMPPASPRREKNITLRGVNGENVKLNESEIRTYDRYHAMAKQQLERVIRSPGYQHLPDDRKAELLDSIYKKFRRAANNEINNSIRRRTTVGD